MAPKKFPCDCFPASTESSNENPICINSASCSSVNVCTKQNEQEFINNVGYYLATSPQTIRLTHSYYCDYYSYYYLTITTFSLWYVFFSPQTASMVAFRCWWKARSSFTAFGADFASNDLKLSAVEIKICDWLRRFTREAFTYIMYPSHCLNM